MGSSTIPAAGGGVTQKVQEFTSTASFVTPSNVTAVQVFLVGGGGGGGRANNDVSGTTFGAAGAAGGEVIEQMLPVTAGTTYTVTIGAAGAGATTNANGSTGGTTSFGALLSAFGGNGGASVNQSVGATYPPRGGGSSASVNNQNGGCGGGAGGPGIITVGFGNAVSSLAIGAVPAVNQRTTGGGTGFQSSSSYTIQSAGIGKQGFGNGGAGGFVNFVTSLNVYSGRNEWFGTGMPSFFNRDTSVRTNGAAASANTGDGGHGGITTSTPNDPQNGWAGGSGFARVIYWS